MNKAVLKTVRKAFGLRVRELRKERGWSQEDFADRCELHRTYIGAVERGEQNISLENIAKIAGALQVGISNLFSD
jgi:transcriptional regulator with XRE-family HTH domain